jgi:hypothetical protein
MQTPIKIQTHRFLFNEQFMVKLHEFSKFHQYDERKMFKTEWEKWSNQSTIREIIEAEIDRMTKQGFEGDIPDKMFKSARYYFRKKSLKQELQIESIENPESLKIELEPQSEIKKKERIPKEWLKQMDKHIKEQIQKNINPNTNISETKPYDSFIHYCGQYKDEIYKQIQDTDKQNHETINNYIEKIKKVYKNRFYKIKMQTQV